MSRRLLPGGGRLDVLASLLGVRSLSQRGRWSLLLILCAGLGLRAWAFPRPQEIRDSDEIGYLSGGLALWEGMQPGYKFSPAGPITWASWGAAALTSAMRLADPPANASGAARPVQLLLSLEAALFDLYADMGPLHCGVGALVMLASMCAIAAAYFLGHHRAGLPGAVLCGGLAAVTPIFVEYSGVARPYADAWAYAVMALSAALLPQRRIRLILSAVLMGIAIATRIDMLLIAPLVIWSLAYEPSLEPIPWRSTVAWLAIVACVSVMVSPWFVTGLLGNLRTIYTVRFLGHRTLSPSPIEGLGALFMAEGLLPAAVLALASCFATRPRPRLRDLLLGAYLLLLIASVAHGTVYGLRHQGATVIALIALAPRGLLVFPQRKHATAAIIFVSLTTALVQSTLRVVALRRNHCADSATEWIETHVPPGTKVYFLAAEVRPPLPTSSSARRLWDDVVSEEAWQAKLSGALSYHGMTSLSLPRVLSDEHMSQQRSNRRRWFILGSDVERSRPRYDVWLITSGSLRDVSADVAATDIRQHGGAIIWRGQPLPQFAAPNASWIAESGSGTYVYYVARDDPDHSISDRP